MHFKVVVCCLHFLLWAMKGKDIHARPPHEIVIYLCYLCYLFIYSEKPQTKSLSMFPAFSCVKCSLKGECGDSFGFF